jgi:Glycosyl transferases group 1
MHQNRHALLVAPYGSGLETIAAGQVAPFLRHRSTIRSELGLTFEFVDTDDLVSIAKACDEAASRVSAFLIRPTWQIEPEAVIRFFADLRKRHPQHWIVSIDPWDQCTGRFLGVLEYVDRLLKYQTLKNRDDYYRPMVGGTVLTDYMADRNAFDEATRENLGSKMPAGAAERVVTGWYFWSPRSLPYHLAKPRTWPFFPWRRSIDVVCHVSIGHRGDEGSYYAMHRLQAMAALQPLDAEYTLRLSADYDKERKVSRRQYLQDCRHAKIMVSPFGWGEISSRDYESVVFGSLLVRPRVDHVGVRPDLFIPGQTYVPVEWDWSDLASTCRHYLTHWDEAERIVENARAAYRSFFDERHYLDVIRETMGMTVPVSGR